MTIPALLAASSYPEKFLLGVIPGGGTSPTREPVGNTTSAVCAAAAAGISGDTSAAISRNRPIEAMMEPVIKGLSLREYGKGGAISCRKAVIGSDRPGGRMACLRVNANRIR